MQIEYQLRYLPLFYDDLSGAVHYISNRLHNPSAAIRLLDAVESAILKRLPDAESFEQYHSKKERTYPYYRIYVNDYVVYYVVIPVDDNTRIMEVRRLLHSLQNRDQIV